MVGHSDFRLAAYCGMAAGSLPAEHQGEWFEHNRTDDLDPLSYAVGWLRALTTEIRMADSEKAP